MDCKRDIIKACAFYQSAVVKLADSSFDEKTIKLEGGVLRGEGCRFNFYKSQKHVRFFLAHVYLQNKIYVD